MLENAIPPRVREGLSWRVSSVSGNPREVLVAGEESHVILPVGSPEAEWVEKLSEVGLWGGGAKPVIDEAACLDALGLRGRVVLTDDYLKPWVAEALREARKAWLVKLRGDEVWIGPQCEVGDGRYEELAYWLRARRAERAAVTGWRYPPAVAVGWNAASLELAKHGWREKDAGALCCFDGRTGQATRHELDLPAYGGGGKVGVVNRIVHEGFGYGAYHAMAEYCLPPLQDGWRRKRTRGFAYGSGDSAKEARQKAMWEAAERFSCFFDVAEDLGKEDAEEIFIGAQEHDEELSSVGCAAGASIEDAVQRATAEVVERFAVRRWWHERERHPGERRDLAGREAWVLNLRCELGWEVAVAIQWPAVAAGCARDWEGAGRKALAELAQVSYWRDYWRDTSISGYAIVQDFQVPHFGDLPPRSRRDMPTVIVVNLTRRRVGVPVVRVMIPGLQPPAPGRVRCPL